MKPRLVILVSHPIQYYAPLYRELALRGDIDVHVVYLSDAGANAYHDVGFGRMVSWDIPLLEGYPYTVLEPDLDLATRRFWSLHSFRLKETLDWLDPDAILLYGYASRLNWSALDWARRRRRKVLYISDSNANTPRSRWKSWLKKVVVGNFFSKVDAFLCTSESNSRYLSQYGAGVQRICRLPFAIDVSRFSNGAKPPGQRRSFDFVWAGKLIPRKRPRDFIDALQIFADISGLEVSARVIGDGPLLEELAVMARTLHPRVTLQFDGFANQSAMPALLQESAVFVFTSEAEPYGLVATEAAAAGLALIVAEGIGCIGDTVLARPGVNAIIYPLGDVMALAKAMLRLRVESDLLLEMQQASSRIASDHDIPVAADVIDRVVRELGVTGKIAQPSGAARPGDGGRGR
ncbi:MAG: glycosyltransferase family 4 protein [Pseudoxanthomonas sp.]